MTNEEKEAFYNLGMHEAWVHEGGGFPALILRVPGGWIYSLARSDATDPQSVFVPFDNEFQPVPPPTDKF